MSISNLFVIGRVRSWARRRLRSRMRRRVLCRMRSRSAAASDAERGVALQ